MKIRQLFHELLAPPYSLPQSQVLDFLSFSLQIPRDAVWGEIDAEYWGAQETLEKNLELLGQFYPLPYITNRKFFLGAEFYVDSRVLIPRDETEGLVELAGNWLKHFPRARIVDVGTGSGIIGLSLKRLFPESQILLTDNSLDALVVAEFNAKRQKLDVSMELGDYLDPIENLAKQPHLIITNPPYIDRHSSIWAKNLKYEPMNALFAPQQGLFFYKKLFHYLKKFANQSTPPQAIMMEFGINQKPALEKLLIRERLQDYYKIKFHRDLNHCWRYLVLEMDRNAHPSPS